MNFCNLHNLDELIKLAADPQRDEYYRMVAENAFESLKNNYLQAISSLDTVSMTLEEIYFYRKNGINLNIKFVAKITNDVFTDFKYVEIYPKPPSVVITETQGTEGFYDPMANIITLCYYPVHFAEYINQEKTLQSEYDPYEDFPDEEDEETVPSSNFFDPYELEDEVIKNTFIPAFLNKIKETFIHEFMHYLTFQKSPAYSFFNELETKTRFLEDINARYKFILEEFQEFLKSPLGSDISKQDANAMIEHFESMYNKEKQVHYQSSPQEFNSFSQDVILKINSMLKRSPESSKKYVLSLTFDEFISFFQIEPYGSIRNLLGFFDPKYHKKLLNRIYQYYASEREKLNIDWTTSENL